MHEVRINTEFDIDEIFQIYMEERWWRPSKCQKTLLESAIKRSFAYACAYEGKRIVGVGRVSSDGISDAYIHDVGVKKEYRGKGIGREIVKALLEWLDSKGIDWIVLIAKPGTEKFWKHMGFFEMNGFTAMRHVKQ